VKVQHQVRRNGQRASGARRAITSLAIVALSIAAGVFFGKFYFVRELLLFVIIAAFLVFFGATVALLGILCHAAGRRIFQFVRRAKPEIAAQGEANVEGQAGPFVGSPTVVPPHGVIALECGPGSVGVGLRDVSRTGAFARH
jgi:hypothetical protein